MTQQAKHDIKVITVIWVSALILGTLSFLIWYKGIWLPQDKPTNSDATWLTPIGQYPQDDDGNYIIGEQDNFTIHNPQSPTVTPQGELTNGN